MQGLQSWHIGQHAGRSRWAAHLDNVAAGVAGLQVAIGVGCAVAAIVDALALALVAGAVRLGAHPHDVVRREARPVALQLARHWHKLLSQQSHYQALCMH